MQDARTEEEYAVSHISGACRVDPDVTDLHQTLNKLKEYEGKCICNLMTKC